MFERSEFKLTRFEGLKYLCSHEKFPEQEACFIKKMVSHSINAKMNVTKIEPTKVFISGMTAISKDIEIGNFKFYGFIVTFSYGEQSSHINECWEN